MKKGEGKYLYRRICTFLLTMIATGMFFFVWYKFVEVNNQTQHMMGIANLGMALLIYLAGFYWLGHVLRAFRIGVERIASVLASLALTIILTNIAEEFLSLAITGQFRFFFDFLWRYALLTLAQILILCPLAWLMITIYRKIFPPLVVLEIYGEREHGLTNKINGVHYKYHVSEKMSYTATKEELLSKMQECDAVLIGDIPAHDKNKIMKLCFDIDKRVYIVPSIGDIITRSSEELNLFDTPLFLCRNMGMRTSERIIKRILDLFFSLLALILTSPVLLITAIAIKAQDGGPVFFRQERCTIGGKHFMILKFRSMIVDAEKDGRPHPAGEKDDRITKVGRFIRATRIDELPQLINIIKGDMSIVGPRPERVEHVEKYTKDIPEFIFRYKVKGGLTGYAQVYGKYNTTALDKLKLDLIYIMNYSILMDIQIVFETVKILFQKESTEGFSENKIMEMHDGSKGE